MLGFLFALALGTAQPIEDPFVIEEPAPAAEAAVAPQAPQAAATPAATAPSDQRLICRSRPRLGSRLLVQRICKTAEDWVIYDNDLEASRRDIADRGARGC